MICASEARRPVRLEISRSFGDLSEIGGGSRTHQTDFCSSSNQVLFVYETGATPGATDTAINAMPALLRSGTSSRSV